MPLLDAARNLDLSRAMRLIDPIRRRYFSVKVPTANGIAVDVSPSELNRTLRNEYHFEGTKAAYYYVGELHNLRRAEGFDTIEMPGGEREKMMELHPRLFELANAEYQTFVMVHYEASRVESPDAHIAEHGMSWERGIDKFGDILDDVGVDYEVVKYGTSLHPS